MVSESPSSVPRKSHIRCAKGRPVLPAKILILPEPSYITTSPVLFFGFSPYTVSIAQRIGKYNRFDEKILLIVGNQVEHIVPIHIGIGGRHASDKNTFGDRRLRLDRYDISVARKDNPHRRPQRQRDPMQRLSPARRSRSPPQAYSACCCSPAENRPRRLLPGSGRDRSYCLRGSGSAEPHRSLRLRRSIRRALLKAPPAQAAGSGLYTEMYRPPQAAAQAPPQSVFFGFVSCHILRLRPTKNAGFDCNPTIFPIYCFPLREL